MISILYHLKINLFKCSIQAWFCSITLLLRRSVELNCKSTGNINQYLNYILHVYYGCKFFKFTFYENSEYLQFLKDKVVCSNLQSNVVTIHKNSDPLELCLQINFLRRQLQGILLYTQARTSLLHTFFSFYLKSDSYTYFLHCFWVSLQNVYINLYGFKIVTCTQCKCMKNIWMKASLKVLKH